MKKCFIVCPIGHEGSDTRNRSDKLLKHIITPVCFECGYEPIRIDALNTNGIITDEIIQHLKNDELVIADISELNPNAFYEIGYRSALGRHIIHLKSKSQNIPFDISTIRTFDYDITDLDSVDEVKTRLIQTVSNLVDDSDYSSETENMAPNKFNSQIFQELYKIQDMLKDLQNGIRLNDTTAISVLADKLVTNTSKSPDVALMEILLPKLLDNPNQLLELVKLTDSFPTVKK